MAESLPYEILIMAAALAAQEDRMTAVQLASVCRDFANWMIPIIYRAVIYQEEERRSPNAPFKPKPPAKPSFETLLKYGHHVRRLHLRVEFDSTARIILDHCLKVRDLHIGSPEPVADPTEHPTPNPREDGLTVDEAQPNVFSETFLQKASLQKFSVDSSECLPKNYHKSNAFSSLTHYSWNPWFGDIHCSMPNLTHLAVDCCVTPGKAAEILRECKTLEVLVVFPCFMRKEGLVAIQDDWRSQVGGDKRLVIMGESIKDPDGIMPEYGYWETGLTLVREGWSLEKAWWEPTSEGSE